MSSLSTTRQKLSVALLTGALLLSFNAAASPNPFSITSPAGYLNPNGPNYIYGHTSAPLSEQQIAAQQLRRQEIFAKYANPAVQAENLSYQLGNRVTPPVLAQCRANVDKLNLDAPAAEKGEKIYDCVKAIPQYDLAGGLLVTAAALSFTASVFAFAGHAQKKEDRKLLAAKI